MEAEPAEIRVLGCLIEKQRTTPDVYPLSLNALRLACNQATNRDPVVEYDEATIRAALERLGRKGWTRLASGAGSRSIKYRHLLDEALRLDEPELALLGVLMLRGPQTPGELKQRSERLHRFDSLEEVERTLEGLVARELAARLSRRPGQKELRYLQLLGGDVAPPAQPAAVELEPITPTRPTEEADGRVAALEGRVQRLEAEVASLRASLHSLREELGA